MHDELDCIIPWRWSDIYISSVGGAANHSAIGRNLQELAESSGNYDELYKARNEMWKET